MQKNHDIKQRKNARSSQYIHTDMRQVFVSIAILAPQKGSDPTHN